MQYGDCLTQDWFGGKVGGAESLGGIGGNVLNDLVGVGDRLNPNNVRVSGDGEPGPLEEFVGKETALNNSVDVWMPTGSVGVPFDL